MLARDTSPRSSDDVPEASAGAVPRSSHKVTSQAHRSSCTAAGRGEGRVCVTPPSAARGARTAQSAEMDEDDVIPLSAR